MKLVGIIVVLAAIGVAVATQWDVLADALENAEEVPELVEAQDVVQDLEQASAHTEAVENEMEAADQDQELEPDMPESVHLNVPFASAVTDSTISEEVSVIMVEQFLNHPGAGAVDGEYLALELERLAVFQDSVFEPNAHQSTSEIALLLESFYHVSSEVLVEPTIEQIQEVLMDGQVLIVPVLPEELENPEVFYQESVPPYQMLVVHGYDARGFHVHDPVISRGQDMVYRFDVLVKAMHDWNGGDVQNGTSRAVVVTP